MDVTPYPPTSILAHHSHQQQPLAGLLPSPVPNSRRFRYASYYSPTTTLRFPYSSSYSTYRSRSRPFEPRLPSDGSSPIGKLPDELWLEVLKWLEWDELLSLRVVDKHLSKLCLSPGLHQTLTLLSLPPNPLPSLLTNHLLRSVKHLHLHLFPYPSPASARDHPTTILLELLSHVPEDQLISLSLPFSAPYLPPKELGEVLERIGGKLEKLDLRGSALAGPSWVTWAKRVGSKGRGLRELDVGFTAITALPSQVAEDDDFEVWRQLKSLNLSSCANLPADELAVFIRNLPESIEHLDLTRLDQVTFAALAEMRVTTLADDTMASWAEAELMPSPLKEIKVVGIDHLTRTDVRKLKWHWEAQRRKCLPFPPTPPLPIAKAKVWGEPRTPSPEPVPGMSSCPSSGSSSGEEETLSTPPQRDLSPPGGLLAPKATHPFLQDIPAPTPPDLIPPLGLPYAGVDPYDPAFIGLSTFRSPLSIEGRVRRAPPHEPGMQYIPQTPYRPDRKRGYRPPAWSPAEPGVSINIHHSAILESEDEEGYRRFIGEVAGGVVPLPLPAPYPASQLGTGVASAGARLALVTAAPASTAPHATQVTPLDMPHRRTGSTVNIGGAFGTLGPRARRPSLTPQMVGSSRFDSLRMSAGGLAALGLGVADPSGDIGPTASATEEGGPETEFQDGTLDFGEGGTAL